MKFSCQWRHFQLLGTATWESFQNETYCKYFHFSNSILHVKTNSFISYRSVCRDKLICIETTKRFLFLIKTIYISRLKYKRPRSKVFAWWYIQCSELYSHVLKSLKFSTLGRNLAIISNFLFSVGINHSGWKHWTCFGFDLGFSFDIYSLYLFPRCVFLVAFGAFLWNELLGVIFF